MTKHQVDDPNQLQITITERLRSTPTYHRYYADVIALNDKKASGRLLIRMRKEDSLELDLDFTLKTSNALKPIQASNNIGGFNYKNYLLSIGVSHQLDLNDFVELKRKRFSLLGWLRVLKQQKLNAIESSAFKEETKQLLMALILGERSELDRAWMDRLCSSRNCTYSGNFRIAYGLIDGSLGMSFLSHYGIYPKEITYRFL